MRNSLKNLYLVLLMKYHVTRKTLLLDESSDSETEDTDFVDENYRNRPNEDDSTHSACEENNVDKIASEKVDEDICESESDGRSDVERSLALQIRGLALSNIGERGRDNMGVSFALLRFTRKEQ